ncbi:ribosome biogenesis/translation initiation ATPase RLI [Candidatus Woesearchaeota archaeon]|nr:ribosome biogenesis/translation initiation ATPase RLI [Candidatus Woesearchaeota archaeon]
MPRIAIVEEAKCHPDRCGNYLCARLCPVNRMGDECISVNESNKKAFIAADLCTGCGICPKRCPFGAIHIINLPEELASQPIHTYGENGFHLYSLPTPMFGKVVGIVGRNGIGKSTAIKILAGVLKPNFGKGKEASYDELIAHFKGSETQLFFERVKRGEIKIAHKPQQVDLLATITKGTVTELLERVDEKGKKDRIIAELDLSKFLDRTLDQLSGGELQRVAIAATVLKKANFYVFDEPTSFLDIKQRLKIAKFIKSLADEDTAVMVIEHDLIILDYMADLIHVMYGEEACYGIVSHLKATKNGINAYLEGYLRDDNMRFRDHPIVFAPKPPQTKKVGVEIVSWSNLRKTLGNFSLQADEGIIHKAQVIGILGENGIGKTSFVKMLANVITPDKGEISGKVSVAYKPQYIDTTSEDLVQDLLEETLVKYEIQLVKPLKLKDLIEKRVCDLSGGELQRVAIAMTLAKDADLYLLDEPSAYLDVEQRLIISKVIRELMELKGKAALVVDHDLLFIDYISQKIVVVDGEPAIRGAVMGPFGMEEGMNRFLEDIDLTFRRDPNSNMPRANKVGSQMDREQKAQNRLYYS